MSAAIPIRLIEGWDHISISQASVKNWTVYGSPGSPGSSMQAGRIGGQCYRMIPNGGWNTWAGIYKTAAFSAIANGVGFSMGCGFYAYWDGTGSQSARFRLSSTASGPGTLVAALQFRSDQYIDILNAAGSVVATSSAPLVNQQWAHVELVGTIGTSVTLTLYVNGTQSAQATGANVGTASAISISMENMAGNGGPYVQWDDIFVAAAATQLGDSRVETIRPTSAGTYAQWAPNASTNVSRVGTANDTSSYDGDTTYNADLTVGHKDSFVPSQLATVSGTVHAVQINLVASKDDAGSRQIADLIRQSSTDYQGSQNDSPSQGSYSIFSQIHNQDPTGTDWTVSTVNGDEYGYIVVS